MPFLTFPLALFTLAAVPTLAAIYWLRNRFRQQPVSSLMLWMDQHQAREGGLRVKRIQTPLLFFLEMAALILLAIAATAPQILWGFNPRPLVIVLDNSYSMQAKAGADARTVRDRARQAVEREIDRESARGMRIILAGEEPRVLVDAGRTRAEAASRWEEWKCDAVKADLDRALALAGELGGPDARILVVTDVPPSSQIEDGRVRWLAFGTREPNLAIVTAARTRFDKRDRCLFEVANLDQNPRKISLIIEQRYAVGEGSPAPQMSRVEMDIAPGATSRAVLEVDSRVAQVCGRLADDALSLDNEVVLVPPPDKKVRVQVAITDPKLRPLVELAIKSTDEAILVPSRADVMISDAYAAPVRGTWQVMIENPVGDSATPYVGPFVVNRAHPVARGLTLDGIVWSGQPPLTDAAATQPHNTAWPIISAGNTPLLTDAERAGRDHDLWLSLRSELSTLTQAPAWPILWWNLVHWRATTLPGLDDATVHVGGEVGLAVRSDVEQIELTTPSGAVRHFAADDGRVTMRAEETGVYQVRAGTAEYAFSAAPMNRDESDLSHAATSAAGAWETRGRMLPGYHDLTWLLLVSAMLCLAVHAYFLSRSGRAAHE